ncbi:MULTISPECIES: 1-(5-phosphoribosyl)-5-[(5-phosphoribosylamino)methylideneamino]imidazole-4-carboxamide isomerase [unclassified Ruminococcus]|uniref:1-(5-phosphoribosyl)-5-[(5- phosphoribosylamino)methylideneamino]imidazole-4- carboxamide isomerase n=1 Tax=unclassified Ruminococcus TaxID=2608920 RepID=UPI00210D4BBF|nr:MULTISPECIES: 1-(5-phosphoribosyl)-5-[(5-phosphoribosylamino)methylideneamino]imidazole-4-carboxamide isomerase [unclassified Ruminococcus]MCQ4021876.1 1-(5-phosphoribosyl)-5-[(5-phosphoribosylamino)methylideneamino]imidazole-4-carboxamide isomerase [Ruminococcus sp. zg-924]MCQ4114321.1 1-(5-phosphoribosyl)-5-[(5-phosphoribosylamino)methylideneamino]imidazole-4-carboxamide isomerase [Ruminococcus sp. zg-921]
MIVLPAIDLKDGNCVRLLKGDYSTVHKVADSPLETAQAFQDDGATWIHMVDLDGAKDGVRKNHEIILNICEKTNLNVEVGGGIRDMEAVDFYLQNGAARVILGSAALKNKQLVVDAVNKYGEKIAVGIDAKDGLACAEGWLDNSGIGYITLAKEMEKIGVSKIIFTDISKDGMLSGPNLVQLDELKASVSCDIIASGGVSNLKDIINLAELNIYGAIAGKAIYTGDLKLKDAIIIGKRVEKTE